MAPSLGTAAALPDCHATREDLGDRLDALRAERHATIRRLVAEDLRLDVLAWLVGLDYAEVHRLLAEGLAAGEAAVGPDGQCNGMGLAARGFGKSTILDVLYAAARALANPNVRGLIASKTHGQAQGFLAEVKGILLHPAVEEVFGPQRGDIWNEVEANVAGRTLRAKECTFSTAGMDGAVVSRHYDFIITDDLVDEENSQTAHQREKVRTFFYKTLLPTLMPGGVLRVLGTRFHPEDLYSYLEREDPAFAGRVVVVPALVLREAHAGGPAEPWTEERYRSTYEAKFSTKYLLALRARMPKALFDAQYQMDTRRLGEGQIIHRDDLRYYDRKQLAELLPDLYIWQAADLAVGQSKENARFAHATVGVHKLTEAVYLLDYYAGQLTFYRQLALLVERYDRWDPIRVGIESNAYQLAMVQAVALNPRTRDIRVKPLQTDTGKETRAIKFSAYTERHEFYLPGDGSMDEVEEQLVGMPKSTFKDIFDAIYMAVYLGRVLRARRQRRREPGVI